MPANSEFLIQSSWYRMVVSPPEPEPPFPLPHAASSQDGAAIIAPPATIEAFRNWRRDTGAVEPGRATSVPPLSRDRPNPAPGRLDARSVTGRRSPALAPGSR